MFLGTMKILSHKKPTFDTYTVWYEQGGGPILLGAELPQEVIWRIELGHTGKVLVPLRLPHHVVKSLGTLLHILKGGEGKMLRKCNAVLNSICFKKENTV